MQWRNGSKDDRRLIQRGSCEALRLSLDLASREKRHMIMPKMADNRVSRPTKKLPRHLFYRKLNIAQKLK